MDISKIKNLKKVPAEINKRLWEDFKRKFRGAAGGEIPACTFNYDGRDEVFFLCNCEDESEDEILEIIKEAQITIEDVPVCSEKEIEMIFG